MNTGATILFVCALVMCEPACAGVLADPYGAGAYGIVAYSAWFPAYKVTTYGTAPSMLNGVDVIEGYQISPNCALEAGVGYAGGSRSALGIDLWNVSVDALGFLPFGRGRFFALLGDVGISGLRGQANADLNGVTVGTDQTESDAHVGGGAQYQFNNSLGIRGLVRYEWTNFSTVGGAAVVSLGLVWRQ